MNKLNKQAKQKDTHRWRADDRYRVGLWSGVMELKGKRAHGQGQQCGDCCKEGVYKGTK